MALKQNIIANYLGQGWAALMGLAFIPFYIATLGVEAWGLIGFMAMLQAWFLLLDMGLTPALSREMARFLGGEHSAQSIRDLLRSLEIVYVSIATVISVVVWLGSDWISSHWLTANQLPEATVRQAVAVMGLVVAARMTEQVYRGAIQGLQRQVWLNKCLAIFSTLRWAGVIPVLWWIDTSLLAFFLWQGLVSIVSVLVLARYAYLALPPLDRSARFSMRSLQAIKGFAGGMASTTLLALILTQVDKLLLSKLVSLDEFGYYAIGTSVAAALGFLVAPAASAVLPRMTECLTRHDQEAVTAIYHSASQWLAAVLIPASLVMAVFAQPLIFAWMGDAEVATRTAPLLTLLALGTMFNGFMQIPYTAQLAHGWTSMAVRINLVAVCLIVPGILWSVPRHGVTAAAWAWLLLNVGYVLISVHFMHRKIMRAEKWIWYRDAVFRPLLVAGIFVVLVHQFFQLPDDRLGIFFALTTIGTLTSVLVIGSLPLSRQFFSRRFRLP